MNQRNKNHPLDMADEANSEKLRTLKSGEWYWVNKAVIQEHARRVGFLAVAVYHLLASMADECQSCYPSQKYIADKLGCSRWSANRAIKKLVESRLVSVQNTVGRRNVYRLISLPISLPMSANHTTMLDKGNLDVGNGNTNNNKEQDINNNTFVRVQKDTTTNEHDEDDNDSRIELLAKDLSQALNDQSHYSIYLSYARQYPESFLRRVLAETKMTPDVKIRKSRAALFNYLVYHYAGKGD